MQAIVDNLGFWVYVGRGSGVELQRIVTDVNKSGNAADSSRLLFSALRLYSFILNHKIQFIFPVFA